MPKQRQEGSEAFPYAAEARARGEATEEDSAAAEGLSTTGSAGSVGGRADQEDAFVPTRSLEDDDLEDDDDEEDDDDDDIEEVGLAQGIYRNGTFHTGSVGAHMNINVAERMQLAATAGFGIGAKGLANLNRAQVQLSQRLLQQQEEGGEEMISTTLLKQIQAVLRKEERQTAEMAHRSMQVFSWALDHFTRQLFCPDTSILDVIGTLTHMAPSSHFFRLNGLYGIDDEELNSFLRHTRWCVRNRDEVERMLKAHHFNSENVPLFLLQLVETLCNKAQFKVVFDWVASKKNRPKTEVEAIHIYHYISIVNNIADFVDAEKLRSLVESVIQMLEGWVFGLENEGLKGFERGHFDFALNSFETLCSRLGMDFEKETTPLAERLRAIVAIKQLKCPYMQPRIAGIKELRAMVERAERMRLQTVYRRHKMRLEQRKRPHPDVVSSETSSLAKRKKPVNGDETDEEDEKIDSARGNDEVNPNPRSASGDLDGSVAVDDDEEEEFDEDGPRDGMLIFSREENADKDALSFFKSWKGLMRYFLKIGLVQLLFGAEFIHTEILKRSADILQFMASENAILFEDLDLMWDTAWGTNAHESIRETTYHIITVLAKYLHMSKLLYIWNNIRSVPLEEHDEKSLLFARNFTTHAFASGRNDFIEGEWLGIDLFWEMVQDECTCTPAVHKTALKYLSELAAWPACAGARENLMQKCIENLRASISVPQSLKLLRAVLTTFPPRKTMQPLRSQQQGNISHTSSSSSSSDAFMAQLPSQGRSLSRETMSKWFPELMDLVLANLSDYKRECDRIVRDRPDLRVWLLNASSDTLPPVKVSDDDLNEDEYECDLYEEEKDDAPANKNLLNITRIVGKYSHLRTLRIRMNFLRFLVLMDDGEEKLVQFSLAQTKELFMMLGQRALTHEERGLLLSWTMQLHFISSVFPPETPELASTAVFRQFPLATIQAKEFSFFDYFFRVVNLKKGCLDAERPRPFNFKQVSSSSFMTREILATLESGSGQRSSLGANEFKVLHPHLFGHGMLWTMALRSSKATVARRAQKLLCSLYAAVSPDVDPEIPLKEKDDDVQAGWDGQGLLFGGFMREGVAQLKQALSIPNAENYVVRCLNLLKELRASVSLSTASTHSARVKKVYRKKGIMKGPIVQVRLKDMQGPIEHTMFLPVDATISQLRKAAAETLKTDKELRFFSLGRAIAQKMSDAALEAETPCVPNGVAPGVLIQYAEVPEAAKRQAESDHAAEPNTKRRRMNAAEGERSNSGAIDPLAVLKEPETAHIISDLLFAEDSQETVATHAWSLLMELPTDPALRRKMQALEFADWGLFVSPSSLYKALYSLQISLFLLCDDEEQNNDWRDRAVDNGLLEHLVVFLGSISRLTSSEMGRHCALLAVSVMTELVESYRERALKVAEELSVVLLESVCIIATDADPGKDKKQRDVDLDLVKASLRLCCTLLEDKEHILGVTWYERAILQCHDGHLKVAIVQAVRDLSKQQPKLLNAIPNAISVASQEKYSDCTSEFFELLCEFISTSLRETEACASVLKLLAKTLTNYTSLETHPISLKRREDHTLRGLLQCLRVSIQSPALASLAMNMEIICFVFDKCLFQTDPANSESSPICKFYSTRAAGFEFLLHAAKFHKGCHLYLLDRIIDQNRQADLGPEISQRAIDYLKFPASVRTLFPEPMDGLPLRDRENSWQYAPSQCRKAPCGYVGLRNLGCICYMNSLMQQLFMIPRFRLAVFETPGLRRGRSTSISSGEEMDEEEDDELEDLAAGKGERSSGKEKAEQNEERKENRARMELLRQIQKMFVYLQDSERKSFNTKQFCRRSISLNQGKPVDIFEQQDVDEFFNVLMDQLETVLEQTSRSPNVVRELFGGVLCNQVICKEGCRHRSEREEEFMVCQLEVKGKKSIKESLDLYVEGEMLEGENKYLCGECNEKRDAQKRACFVSLPNVLIVHLKRFDYDLELLRKIKVNDHCEFPEVLNMEKYTKDFLDKAAASSEETPEAGGDSQHDYELVGILVHSGTADTGHYYSFIKERFPIAGRESSEWFQFNDEIVTPFDPATIPHACFGGSECSMRFDPLHGKNMPNLSSKPFSAYLLIYQKKSLPCLPSEPEASPERISEILAQGAPEAIRTEVFSANQEILQDELVFRPEYPDFMVRLASIVTDLETGKEDLVTGTLEAVTSFAINTLVHAKEKDSYDAVMRQIQKLRLRAGEEGRQALLTLFEANGATVIKQLLMRCPVAMVRENFELLLNDLLLTNIEQERAKYREVDSRISNFFRMPYFEYAADPTTFPPDARKAILVFMWKECFDSACVPPVKSLVARMIGWMLAHLVDSSADWKHLEQFFLVLRWFGSAGPEELDLLLEMGTVPRLVDFVLGPSSPLTKHKMLSNDLDDRRPMFDKFVVPKLSDVVHLLRLLVHRAELPTFVVDNRDQLGQDVSSLTWIDYELIFFEPFLPTLVGFLEAKDFVHLEAVILRLVDKNEFWHRKFILDVVPSMASIQPTQAEALFRIVLKVLAIEYSEDLTESLCRLVIDLGTVGTDSTSPRATLVATHAVLHLLRDDNVRQDFAVVAADLHESWLKAWLVEDESAAVRRRAAVIILHVVDALEVEAKSEIPSNGKVFHSGRAKSFVKAVVEMYSAKVLYACATKERYDLVDALNSKHFHSAPRPPLRTWQGEKIEPRQPPLRSKDWRFLANELSSEEMEPDHFKMVSILRLLRYILAHHERGDMELLDTSQIELTTKMIADLDTRRSECDWNKGELIRFLDAIFRVGDERYLRRMCLKEGKTFETLTNISMTVRPTDDHFLYNDTYTEPLYNIFVKWILHPETREAALKSYEKLHHLQWALKYYFLDNQEFPKAAPALDFLMRAVFQRSMWLRDTISKDLFGAVIWEKLKASATIGRLFLDNICSTLKHFLGLRMKDSLFHVHSDILEDVAANTDPELRRQCEQGSVALFVRSSHAIPVLERLLVQYTKLRPSLFSDEEERENRLVEVFELVAKSLETMRAAMDGAPSETHKEIVLDRRKQAFAFLTDLLPRLTELHGKADEQKALCNCVRASIKVAQGQQPLEIDRFLVNKPIGSIIRFLTHRTRQGKTAADAALSNEYVEIMCMSAKVFFEIFASETGQKKEENSKGSNSTSQRSLKPSGVTLPVIVLLILLAIESREDAGQHESICETLMGIVDHFEPPYWWLYESEHLGMYLKTFETDPVLLENLMQGDESRRFIELARNGVSFKADQS